MRNHCELCGKSTAFGHNVSHSNRKTPRRFSPNIQRASIMVGGYRRNVQICTRCMRTLAKQGRL